MDLKYFSSQVNLIAKKKGWYNVYQSDPDRLMQAVYELAKASEAIRNDQPPIYQVQRGEKVLSRDNSWNNKLEPEGPVMALAFCIIRILDVCGNRGWDIQRALKLAVEHLKSKPLKLNRDLRKE